MNKIIEFDINKESVDKERISEIEELLNNNLPINDAEVELLLRNLSYTVRKQIAEKEETNMEDYLYPYKCDLAQSMIYYYLEGLNIKANPINTNEVIEGVSGHSIILVNINEKRYLIDPTYIQFFTEENCTEEKFIVIKDKACILPDPGYFVVKDNNEDVLMPLLTDGYIEFNEEVAKAYGDSFFKTKQGTNPLQIDNNTTSGSNYIKWFEHTKSKLSKTKEELLNMNLLIEPDSKKPTRHK